MTFRLILGCVTLAAVSCGPRKEPEPEPVRVWDVSPKSVWTSYADHSARWTGERVRVVLAPGTYAVDPASGFVLWRAADPADPPDVVFETRAAPDAKRTLELVGVCRGRVERGRGKFFVRVTIDELTAR